MAPVTYIICKVSDRGTVGRLKLASDVFAEVKVYTINQAGQRIELPTIIMPGTKQWRPQQ